MLFCARHESMIKAAGALHSRLWREFDAYVEAQTAPWKRKATTILGAEGTRAAGAFEAEGLAAALRAVDPNEWFAYVNRLWLSVAPEAGALVEPYLGGMKARSRIFEALESAVTQYIRKHGAHHAEEITSTSRKTIREQIRIGYEKGESTDEIASRIRKHYRSVSAGRAGTIARTEVHAASNFGSLTAAAEQREPMRKIWLATPDGLTRDAHMDASGQKRMLNEPFKVDGEPLMFPGDSSMGADVSNVANCRCTCAYERIRRPVRPPRPRRVA